MCKLCRQQLLQAKLEFHTIIWNILFCIHSFGAIFFFYDMSYTAMWEELDFYVEKLYNDIMLNSLWKDFIS